MNHYKKPTALIILDGFGYSSEIAGNAIAQAKKPFIDYLLQQYPTRYLAAAGTAVGVPAGIIGNSEVGHVTIGAGRIVQQPITILQELITTGAMAENNRLRHALAAVSHNKTIHIIGLCSDAGIHGDLAHIAAYAQIAATYSNAPIALHLILDGRDSAPQSAERYIQELLTTVSAYPCISIASMSGRYYAMDRDNNWYRTEQAINAMCGIGKTDNSWQHALATSYAEGITDEFFIPTVIDHTKKITSGDLIICANFRPDRMRQLVSCLDALAPALLITPVSYGATVESLALIERTPVQDTLKEVLAAYDKSMFTIAETEKYAHVTYFFAGYKEEPFAHEQRVLIPSHKAMTYVNDPAMAAIAITNTVCATMPYTYDFYLINYANADMVGHSGNLPATIQAIEILDQQLQRLYHFIVEQQNGIMLITADHGNAEVMIDATTGEPYTAHTSNPVPFIVVGKQIPEIPLPMHGLSEIAPYILRLMHLPIPAAMQPERVE